jgi:hypothetical protein
MLFAITGLQRCPVEGIDGRVGTVKDFCLTIRAGRSAGWCSTLVIGARRFAHPGHRDTEPGRDLS